MHKSCPTQIKAAGPDDGLGEGQFRALVSVFGNVDSYGDKVMPGAFTDTLAEWAESGESIPVYYSHQIADPEMNIGWVVEARETDEGLEVLGQLDLEEGAPVKASYVHRLLKRAGGPRDFSFAYDVLEAGPAKDDEGNEYNELRKLKLYEVGPTQVGANPSAELRAVKAVADEALAVVHGLKAGRVLSAKNESTLREAMTALDGCAAQIKSVLAALDKGDDGKAVAPATTQKARETDAAKDKEPSGATPEEPRRRAPANTWEFANRLNILKEHSHASH